MSFSIVLSTNHISPSLTATQFDSITFPAFDWTQVPDPNYKGPYLMKWSFVSSGNISASSGYNNNKMVYINLGYPFQMAEPTSSGSNVTGNFVGFACLSGLTYFNTDSSKNAPVVIQHLPTSSSQINITLKNMDGSVGAPNTGTALTWQNGPGMNLCYTLYFEKMYE